MQRRKFFKTSAVGAATLSSGFMPFALRKSEVTREVYELRQYELFQGYHKNDLDKYFKEALVPALNRLGVQHAGFFTALGKAEPVVIYALIQYPSANDFLRISSALQRDGEFRKASELYDKQPPANPVFNRYKSALLMAFEGFPELKISGEANKLFEIRTYEGYNEDAVRRKIAMFNNGEIDIFLKNKFKPVFYSEVMTGENLPCLTYMLAFDSMEERDAKWKDFGNDPDWKRMSSDPAYANTVSRITKIFLEPLPYSQI